jgi:hypothetical protein
MPAPTAVVTRLATCSPRQSAGKCCVQGRYSRRRHRGAPPGRRRRQDLPPF